MFLVPGCAVRTTHAMTRGGQLQWGPVLGIRRGVAVQALRTAPPDEACRAG